MAKVKNNKKAIPTKKFTLLKDFSTENKTYKKGEIIELTLKGEVMAKNKKLI